MGSDEISYRAENFDRFLMGVVDEGLRVLGRNMDGVICYWLDKRYSLKRDEIPQRLEIFLQCLYDMFGSGASILEKRILEILFYKLGLRFRKKEGYGFLDYVEDAKKIYFYMEEARRQELEISDDAVHDPGHPDHDPP